MSQEGRQIARVWIAVGIMTLMWGMAAATTFASTLALTPAEIVDLGLKADANLKVAALTLDNAKIAYDRSVANNLLGGSPAELRAAEIDWLKAQAGYQGQVADAVISLFQEAIDLRRAELEAEVEGIRLDLARLELERAKERVRAQIANEDAVVEAELAMVGRELSYDEASIELENLRESLGNRIGVSEFTLGEMPVFVEFEAGLEQALVWARDVSADLRESQNSVENAELELERLKIQNAPALDIREAANNLEIAKIRLASVEQQLVDSVESAVRAIERTAVNYAIALRQSELAQRRYTMTQRQAEAGFVTQDAVANAEISILEAEASRLEALRNYATAVLNFQKLVGDDVTASVILRGGAEHEVAE